MAVILLFAWLWYHEWQWWLPALLGPRSYFLAQILVNQQIIKAHNQSCLGTLNPTDPRIVREDVKRGVHLLHNRWMVSEASDGGKEIVKSRLPAAVELGHKTPKLDRYQTHSQLTIQVHPIPKANKSHKEQLRRINTHGFRGTDTSTSK